ncbi:MAG: flagellar basal body L-ring protein FlgH [Pseudomonadota bacterium]
MRSTVFGFVLMFLGGCAWFTPSKNEVEIQPPPKVTHYPQQKPRKINRELGSLWSEDSSWNQMYSPTQTRAPGDIVTIKLDKKFLSRIEQAIKRPVPEELPGADKKESKKDTKRDGKVAKGANTENDGVQPTPVSAEGGSEGRAPASAKAPVKLPEVVEVTILEALPRGVYRVAANHGFKPADDSPFVYIQGLLREREIASDDTTNSDALLDLKFETIKRDMKVTTYEEGEEP